MLKSESESHSMIKDFEQRQNLKTGNLRFPGKGIQINSSPSPDFIEIIAWDFLKDEL